MREDRIEFLQVLAQIAGVFIGFVALLGVSGLDQNEYWIRFVGYIGMLVLIGALMPLLLHQFNIRERLIWVWSAIILFTLIWVGIIAAHQNIVDWFERDLITAIFFWGGLETAIQLPLILLFIGKLQRLDPALYFTALIVNVFEAAWILSFAMA